MLYTRTKGIGDVILSFYGLHLLRNRSVDIYYIGYGTALEFVKYFFPNIYIIDIGKNNLIKSYQIINQALPSLDGLIDLQNNSRSILLKLLLWIKYRMPVFKWNKRSIIRRLIIILNKVSGRNYLLNLVKNYRQPPVSELVTACFIKCVAYFFTEADIKVVKQKEHINKSIV